MQRTRLNSSNIYAIELFSSQAYIPINKKLLKYYGPDVAIFLSNLIDKYKYFADRQMLENEWFFVVHKNQCTQTGLTLNKLRKCKKILIEDSIIEVKRKGVPAKEWYLIDFDKLLRLIIPNLYSRPISRRQDVQLHDDYIIRPNINNLKNFEKRKNTKKERAVQFLPIAEYLSKIIQSKKNISHTSQQVNAWAYDICQLVEDNKVSIERIKTALKWYEKNIGGQYIPVIESGRSLREKFSKLEAAIIRNSSGNNKRSRIMEYGEWWYLNDNGNYYNDEGKLLN